MMNSSNSIQQFDQHTANAVPTAGFSNQNPEQHTVVNWSSGLCDCFSDRGSCCLTCWCPCITFGRIAEILDQGNTSCGESGTLYCLLAWLTGLTFCYSCGYRSQMRRHFMLKESPCCDCLVHFCCEPCALCQEYRELQSRGFDMSIGWHGNVEKQNREVAMGSSAPAVEGGMKR